jgi:Uma2 family endonuclease
MGEAGILGEEARVELIEGELIDMAPIGSRHAGTVDRLARLFFERVTTAIVRIQNPIVLGEHSELEPDLTLLRSRDDFYTSAHPGAADVLLLVEVMDTSARYDREVKIPLYARAGIPEVWLIDLQQGWIEIYLRPSPNGYRQILRPERQEQIILSRLPDVKVTAADLFIP